MQQGGGRAATVCMKLKERRDDHLRKVGERSREEADHLGFRICGGFFCVNKSVLSRICGVSLCQQVCKLVCIL